MKKLSCSGLVHPFFLIIIIILISIPMGFYGMYLYIAPSLPEMSTLKKAPLLKPLQVFSSDNELIAEYGGKLSVPVKYEQIPTEFIHAFLAAEDSSFFEHSGISFKSLGRALSETVTGSDVQTGGSTITMQVAKNYYLSPERTLKRKLTEIFLARKIEQNLSKEEILTLYVNKIFLGKNAYGIAAAAKIYYNKSLEELSIAQMAMISGLPKAPSRYNPVANPKRALERRNWILGRMLQLGYLNQSQYQQAIAEPVNLDMPDRSTRNKFPYVGEMVRSELVQNFGEQAVDSGYKVYTTIHSERQTYAEQAVQEGLEAYDRRHGWRGAEAHDQPPD
ncbi:MAG TPA: penicillin-binding protein, partial [Acinetobacter lwoffii]|nr:penicillin-binding protein [Acinetobacter lwoffii]